MSEIVDRFREYYAAEVVQRVIALEQRQRVADMKRDQTEQRLTAIEAHHDQLRDWCVGQVETLADRVKELEQADFDRSDRTGDKQERIEKLELALLDIRVTASDAIRSEWQGSTMVAIEKLAIEALKP
jgi:hypothetical protein